jgi:hypothetical protein
MDRLHGEHVAAAYREARTVRTVEELDVLPECPLVRSDDRQTWECGGSGFDCLSENGSAGLYPTEEVRLPALVLWMPGDAA